MDTYIVRVATVYTYEIKAETEREAIEIAYDLYDQEDTYDYDPEVIDCKKGGE